MNPDITVRRAKRDDVQAIAALVASVSPQPDDAAEVMGSAPGEGGLSDSRTGHEAEVTDWLFTKGLLVAVGKDSVLAVAAWQAENLVSITDQFHLAPGDLNAQAGLALLAEIEEEAGTLMCEANIVPLPRLASREIRACLEQQGYEPQPFEELHRIWREVLNEFNAGELELLVKRLRDRMVMAPV